MNVFTQEQVFLFFFIIGAFIANLFDFFRVIRKVFQTADLITLLEDIIFIILSGTLIVLGIINLNSGEVRLFLFIGIFFGMVIYFLTLSNLYVIIFGVFVKTCKKFIQIPIYCYKRITKVNIKKDFWYFCRKL